MSAQIVANTATLTGRSLKLIARSPDTIITTAIMPIAMMLLFVYVFGGAIDDRGPATYVGYMLPGILLITVAMGISYTAFRIFIDGSEGISERFLTLPIARSSPLWAQVLTSLVANTISVVIVIAVAFVIGFRPDAGVLDWLAIAGILLLVTMSLTWIAVIAGLRAKSVDGAAGFSYPLIMLPFISSAFVPTDTMPAAVRWFAENQPATAIVDSLRDLFAGRPVGDEIWLALAWCVAIFVIAYAIASATYRKRSA